jgi:hypothetical protein
MTDSNDPIDATVEKALRQALRPVDPPPGFADRVVRRAAMGPARTSHGALFRWAAAAVLVVGVSGGLWYRAEERRRAQGEEARRQVLLSLRIAGAKLHELQMKVNHQGESQQ